MALQYNRYQCRACGKPALHVRNLYDVPNVGYAVVIGFLSVDALIARDELVAPLCLFAAVAVAVLWAIHTVANLIFGGVRFRCQTCGTETGESQKPI